MNDIYEGKVRQSTQDCILADAMKARSEDVS